jgi:hypothetical protein
MMRRGLRSCAWWVAGVVVLLSLPALWPLTRPDFFVSDDGLFHVYRAAALADAWRQGVLYPRLFPQFGFGYGQAVLNFYAPLAYWPAALLSVLGVAPATATEITVAFGFLLAGLAAYGYARYLWGPVAGIVAAVAYTYFPYHLADAYLRGAFPEHFAFIWPPLILWAFTAAFRAEDARGPLLGGSLAWAGLIYTHNLTALLFAPVWLAYIVLLAAVTRWPRRLAASLGSLLVSLGLSAPLWLPFIAERQNVGLALGASEGYREHLLPLVRLIQWLPFYRYGTLAPLSPDVPRVEHPLAWLTVALWVAGLIVLVWSLRHASKSTEVNGPKPATTNPPSNRVQLAVLGFGLALVAGAALMTAAPSLVIWQPLTPVLGMLQYPWRFMVLAAVGVIPVAGAVADFTCVAFGKRHARSARNLPIIAAATLAMVALALLIQPLPLIPAEPLNISAAEAWSPQRMWQEDAAAGQVGATWTGEFLPLAVKEQRWALGRPAENAQDGPALDPRPVVTIGRVGYDSIDLNFASDKPVSISLHQFHLPMWRASADGQAADTYPSGDLALITADAAATTSQLSFRFGPSAAWLIAAALAIVAASVWAALAWKNRKTRIAGVILVIAAIIFALNGLGVGQRTSQPKPAQTALGDAALLIGYDVERARGEDAAEVTLYWLCLRQMATNYKVFVHLLDPDGQVVGQHDGDPVGGFTPTTRWLPGEIIADRHRIALPAGAEGEYGLKAGMYAPATGSEPMENLPVDPPTADGRVDLGRVIVRPYGIMSEP